VGYIVPQKSEIISIYFLLHKC